MTRSNVYLSTQRPSKSLEFSQFRRGKLFDLCSYLDNLSDPQRKLECTHLSLTFHLSKVLFLETFRFKTISLETGMDS